jgi:DNA primase
VARIADEEIERLKEEVDLGELVRRAGVELRGGGRDLVGFCPFHDDRTRSLVVTPSKGLWHCMGACQAGGSVIDWVMRAQSVSFRHAVELLREGAVLHQPAGQRAPSRVRLEAPISAGADEQEALSRVVDYYHARLTASPEALSYLSRRRIDDPEAITRFRLGYADRSLGLRLPDKKLKAGAAMRGLLERVGLYRASGLEHLAGSVVVPVITPEGRVAELYGRKIGDHLRQGTPLHLYLPGPHKGVFNEEALAASTEVILTESLIDALSFWCAGIRNVTSSYGAGRFTDDHREAFSRHRVARVLVAYDNDKAGDVAAKALADELTGIGIECFRIVLPKGKDVNDVATSAPSPAEALADLVRSAEFVGRAKGARVVASAPSAAKAATAAEPARAVSPVPPLAPSPAVASCHDELQIEIGKRRWRVRHIPSGPTPGSLKVNVMVQSGDRFHLDVVDLYSARSRNGFCEAAASELSAEREELRREIGTVLLSIEEAQAAAAAPQNDAVSVPTGERREAAEELLSNPALIGRVGDAFSALGVVGEKDAALVAWLVLTSRLADRPLGAVIQSSSAAGKSTLADAALALFPEEHKVAFSAMTGQALYYLGESDLSHKALYIAEEEGASRASYALKLLVSEGELSIAAAGKDPVTGRLVTNTYCVKGPVALLMTTTAAELEPELQNRLVVLSTDEGRAQTRAVQVSQREQETLAGLLARQRRAALQDLHHDAQRLLHPVAVVNPHAPETRFPDAATRHRRDHAKLLGPVRAVTLAHQHQRQHRLVEVGSATVTYIEATEDDVRTAERLAEKVLAASSDDLSPPTRRLLGAVAELQAAIGGRQFTRRELREATGFGDTQLKVHLARLVDLEYVSAHGAGPATTYELATAITTAVTGGDRSGPGSDRSGATTDRSGHSADRSAIGRIRASSENEPITRQNGRTPSGSVGIGRVDEREPIASASCEVASGEPDRSVAGRLRVVGESDVVVVEGAR